MNPQKVKSILFDQNPDNSEIISSLLADKGISVHQARSVSDLLYQIGFSTNEPANSQKKILLFGLSSPFSASLDLINFIRRFKTDIDLMIYNVKATGKLTVIPFPFTGGILESGILTGDTLAIVSRMEKFILSDPPRFCVTCLKTSS